MAIAFFIYGLLLGSFFNVVGLRVPNGRSILSPRSGCPNCGHQLSTFELIPVLSYIFQVGRCRKCKVKISPVYPFFELITGILFSLANMKIGWQPELIIALTLISMFVIISVSDLTYMIIPDSVLLVFGTMFIVERILVPLSPWWDSIAGATVGYSFLLLIFMVSKGGMGGGDIKLFAVIGYAVGIKTMLLSFFFSTFFGALFGVIFMMFKVVKRNQKIPFGPFIAMGTLVAYFFGEEVVRMYLHLLIFGF